MDLPDIMTVIQWGATCSISTLWQWFGRCVRDPSLQGTAVLFATKDNFDPERQKKVDRTEKRQATATLKKQGIKRQKTGADFAVKMEDVTEPGHSVEDEMKQKQKKSIKSIAVGNSKKMLDMVVDTFINAEFRRVECRRIPIMDAFKNNEAGMYHCLVVQLVNLMMHQ
jgi:superfamily II DNA/RNA helicase